MEVIVEQIPLVETSGDSLGVISDKADTTIEVLVTAGGLEISVNVPKI